MGVLFAVLTPIVLLVGALILSESLLADADPNLVAIAVVIGAIVWAAILGVVYTRILADDFRSFLSLAERGGGVDQELGAAYQQLAGALEERNRQLSALARETGAVPIDDAPRRVVSAIVTSARSVMRDPTWRCAILDSDEPELLPPGVYLGIDDERPAEGIGDLERWASVAVAEAPASRLEGPWGAFAVVDVSVSERLKGILYAPWEGRPSPSPAEAALLTLVGQHAGTALEHSLLYARVRSQADELNRLAAIQADFLRGVTHDLQTPLTSIGALATELRANEGMPPEAEPDLEAIAQQADRLRRMVSQLLVASRLEAGVITPQVEVFAVEPLVNRVWSALRADRPFEVRTEGPAHLAVADPDRLEQVLWALLDNAVKYSPAASPIAVTIRPDREALAMAVRDEGAGMDDETRRHAFDQFYRSAQARRLAPDGSGVGLYAARGLVEAMGGSVALESTMGAGTVITVRLPAEPSAGAD